MTFNELISLIMQQRSRNLQNKDQFIITKRPRSRMMLQVPILTVHNNQKHIEQQSKLEKLLGNRLKGRKNINNAWRTMQQVSSADHNILKTLSSKQNMDFTQIPAFETNYKTQYRTITNRPFTNLRKKQDQTGNLNQSRNTSIKRLLEKLSRNRIKSNYSFLMGREEFSDSRTSLSRRKYSQQRKLSESLSCKLVSYNNSNLLSRYNVKKVLINQPIQPSLHKKYSKKQKQFYRKDKVVIEEQLAGWNISLSKQENVNMCSIQSFQL